MNPKDDYGKTPLHYAAENGHLGVCQLILEKVHEKNPKDDYGMTPLENADLNGHSEVVELIKSLII